VHAEADRWSHKRIRWRKGLCLRGRQGRCEPAGNTDPDIDIVELVLPRSRKRSEKTRPEKYEPFGRSVLFVLNGTAMADVAR
jgi:hypothetical protein